MHSFQSYVAHTGGVGKKLHPNVVKPKVMEYGHRTIEYWKKIVQDTSSTNENALDQLSMQVPCSSSEDESVEYRAEKDGGDADRGQFIKMLMDSFETKGDVHRAVQFWKSLVVCEDSIDDADETQVWDSIEAQFDRGVLSKSEIILLCKFKLRQQPGSRKALDALSNYSRSFMDIDSRIDLWRGMIGMGLYENLDGIVNELEFSVREKGDEAYAVDLWTTMARNFPWSSRISEALYEAFLEQGINNAAIECWEKLGRIFPEEPHFGHFLAESAKAVGNFKTAINVWSKWMDYFLREDKLEHESNFNLNTIISSLRDAIEFEYAPSKVLEFWETSCKKYPPRLANDQRPQILATAIAMSEHGPPPSQQHRGFEQQNQLSRTSPTPDKNVLTLPNPLASVPVNGDSSTNQSLGFDGHWDLKLAQLSYIRQDYGRAELHLKTALSSKHIPEDVWATVDSFQLSIDFWLAAVLSDPSPEKVSRLQAACKNSGSCDVAMWKRLIVQHPENSALSKALEAVFHSVRKRGSNMQEEISFWKACVRLKSKAANFCEMLSNAFETRRLNQGHCRIPIATLKQESEEWKSLLLDLDVDQIEGDSVLPEYVGSIIAKTAKYGGLPVWKDGKEFWAQALQKFSNAPPTFLERLRESYAMAESCVSLLEKKIEVHSALEI